MKKIKCSWIVFVICILFLQGCVDVKLDIGESIEAPKNKLISIRGTWKVEKYDTKDYASKKEEINNWLGKTAIFNEEFVFLGEEICEKPEYKVKNIDAKDYFLYTYKRNYTDLSITNKDIEVISITSKEKHFYDFIRLKDDQLMVYIDDVFYYLSQISDVGEPKIEDKSIESENLSNIEKKSEPKLLRSGVLIGLRSLDNDKESETYRTLWIGTKNRMLYPILENPNLLVPRKSGFWMVGKDRNLNDGYINDQLFAYPLEKDTKNKKSVQKAKKYIKDKHMEEYDVQKNIIRKIVFVGNDYIATEYDRLENLQMNDLSRLQVRLMDNVEKNIGIKISDIAGDLGRDAFFNSAKGYITALSKSEVSRLNKPKEEYFKLERRNGHWIMKGRLYYKEENRKNDFLEFNISTMPPKKMVHYDELYITWNEVKAKVPKAIDAYTSPNKDFAIIVTKEYIYIYSLKNNRLSNKYMKKIKLKEGERIVMAEWATGSYVEKWNNFITDIDLNVKE